MKSKIICVCCVVGFSILFPYIVTLIFAGSKDKSKVTEKLYEPENMGQSIVVVTDGRREKMDVEKFIPCVLMTIMDIDTEEEVLKAQVVIIRTEILYKMQGLSNINAEDLDMEYITYQSMEAKWKNDFAKNYNYLMKIVNNTSCQVIKYENNIIMPYYHSVSAGVTREGSFPYLVSVESEGDFESTDYLTMSYYTNEEFYEKVKSNFSKSDISESAPLETLQVIERDSAGYVCTLQIGGIEISGEEFAKCFELKSTYFQVEPFNGNIRIITKGNGHGYGMSIYGAEVYAKAGWSYVQILQHYFSESITLE